ncbi:MAG: hypothetical protein H7141_00125 [Burkholderiales bacterium]|nr:hypothetical protein [Bacteroidia bacterium]
MKFRNYIFVFFIIISSISFSQPVFSNIDSLLKKNTDALNKRDSVYYLSLLNYSAIFKGKVNLTKNDSLLVLRPFTESFFETIESLKEFGLSPDVTVIYSGYECVFKKTDISKVNGKVHLKVSLILNDSFVVNMLFEVVANNGHYSIESPMKDMFIDEKE